MELNPYAKYLDGGDPLPVMTTTPERIAELTSGLPAEALERRPAAGKWNVREIVSHLADCELVFGFRLRQTLAIDGHVVQPFEQDDWAKRYAAYDFESAMAMFRAARTWNLRLIEGTTAEERARPLTHPERGTMTFWTIVETMGGHDKNHLGQIERIARGA